MDPVQQAARDFHNYIVATNTELETLRDATARRIETLEKELGIESVAARAYPIGLEPIKKRIRELESHVTPKLPPAKVAASMAPSPGSDPYIDQLAISVRAHNKVFSTHTSDGKVCFHTDFMNKYSKLDFSSVQGKSPAIVYFSCAKLMQPQPLDLFKMPDYKVAVFRTAVHWSIFDPLLTLYIRNLIKDATYPGSVDNRIKVAIEQNLDPSHRFSIELHGKDSMLYAAYDVTLIVMKSLAVSWCTGKPPRYEVELFPKIHPKTNFFR